MPSLGGRVVTVTGATGTQGVAVVRALSRNGGFDIRACTRNPSSAVAEKLAGLANVIVVQVDYDDEHSLVAAFQGAEAVFGITDSLDFVVQQDPEREIRQGCRMGDICKALGVSVFIWSTAPSGLFAAGGSIDSQPLGENKHAVSRYLSSHDIPHVDLYVGTYMSNWQRLGNLERTADGSLLLTQAARKRDTRIGMSYVEKDLGVVTIAVLNQYRTKREIMSQPLYCMGGLWCSNEFAQELERQVGEKFRLATPLTSGNTHVDHAYGSFNEWGVSCDVKFPHPSHALLEIDLSTLQDYIVEEVVPMAKLLTPYGKVNQNS